MSNVTQEEYQEQKNKIANALTVEEASTRKYCSNCFMSMGLLHIAEATLSKHSKEFCSHNCLMEWEDNNDECA